MDMYDPQKIREQLIDFYNSSYYKGEYEESHRYYHTIDHVLDLFSMIDDFTEENISMLIKEKISMEHFKSVLYVLAFFHDIIYAPMSSEYKYSEITSAKVFLRYSDAIKGISKFNFLSEFLEKETIVYKNGSGVSNKEYISRLIVYTYPTNIIYENGLYLLAFLEMDHKVLLVGSLPEMIEAEKKIYKEFQGFTYDKYILGKEKFIDLLIQSEKYKSRINILTQYLEYVKERKLNIGMYVGSFNPFHKGHANILKKASDVFDKVIVAVGVNPDKTTDSSIVEVCKRVPYNEVISYNGLTTDMIQRYQEKNNVGSVTLIKGLRNSDDLSYEINQLRYMQDMYPNLKVAYFISDKEYDHISSSAIRALTKVGSYEYLRYLDPILIYENLDDY